MRTFLLVFFAIVSALAVQPARADSGNAIKIIGSDGSVTEFKIPKDYRPGTLPPLHGRIEAQKEESAPPSAPVAADEKPVKEEQAKETPVKEEAVKEAVAPESPPPQEKAAIEEAPPAKPVADRKPPAIKEASVKLPPLPGRKPAIMARAASVPAPQIVPAIPAVPEPEPGGVISKNRAVAIALAKAPPASNYSVSRRIEGDRRVYAVLFKTERGPHEVLVDAENGDILRR